MKIRPQRARKDFKYRAANSALALVFSVSTA
jgi:hypothetical protein